MAALTPTSGTARQPLGQGRFLDLTRDRAERQTLIGLVAVATLATLTRLFHLTRLSLWLDEGFSILYSRLAWPTVVGFDGFYSPHPPLYFATIKLVALVAPEALAGRLVSAIAGIATVPVGYLLARELLGNRGALVTGVVLALSPLHVYYSQEARMYALLVFLVGLSYLAAVRFLASPGWGSAAVYGGAVGLAVYVDYSAVYPLLPQAVLLGLIVRRHRHASLPILAATALAILAFLPWLPQVLATVEAANEDARREVYLGVTREKIGGSLLAIVGIARRGSYFVASERPLLNSLAVVLPLTLLAAGPLVVLGLRAMRHRPLALLVTVLLLPGTIVTCLALGLISPGYAERTVLATTLGWSLLVGAAFSAPLSRRQTILAGGSLALLLLLVSTSLGSLYFRVSKTPWREGAADVATIARFGIPIVSYSYGGVVTPLVEVYEADAFAGVAHVPIYDGEMEQTLGNGVLTPTGLSRREALAGGLEARLIEAGERPDLFWFFYYDRHGSKELMDGFRANGYARIFHRAYDSPNYRLYLSLYARPEAIIGAELPGQNPSFGQGGAGWTLPEGAKARLEPSPAGLQLTIDASASLGHRTTYDVPAGGEGLYVVDADARASEPTTEARLILGCVLPDGAELRRDDPEATASGGTGAVTLRASILCPPETTALRVSLRKKGPGSVTFTRALARFLPLPPASATQAAGAAGAVSDASIPQSAAAAGSRSAGLRTRRTWTRPVPRNSTPVSPTSTSAIGPAYAKVLVRRGSSTTIQASG